MPHATSESVSAASATAALRSASPTAVTLLRVYGEDAFSYLQSQVSADLRVEDGQQWVRYALWLDASGHVLADSFVLSEGAESFLLFSYSTPAQRLEEIVLSNVIADDVEVEHLGDDYCHWALWQTDAAGSEALARLLPHSLWRQAGGFALVDLPSAVPATAVTAGSSDKASDAGCVANAATDPAGSATDCGLSGTAASATPVAGVDKKSVNPVCVGLLFAGRNTGGVNYDLLIPQRAALPAFATLLDEVPWAEREAQRIADGVPAVPQDIGAEDLPQEGGDLPRAAVSTSKGCYLGQEMVARWHATGQVRSGLFRVCLLEEASPSADVAGASLPLRLYAGTKPVGQLRSFALSSGAGLALLRIHRLGDARLLSVEAGGAPVFSVKEPMLS